MTIYDLFPNGLSIETAIDLLQPVSVYIVVMVMYALFVFKFYRFVASRDMFALNLSKYEESRFRLVRAILHFVLYVGKYMILFPVFAFFWFTVLTLILAFLSRGQSFSDVLLTALVTVSAIRVTAYYYEELSRDLAKMLPFALLGIFLIDASFFSGVSEALDVLQDFRNNTENFLYYLVFLIAMEFALRLAMVIGIVLVVLKDRGVKKHTLVADVAPAPPAGEPQPEPVDDRPAVVPPSSAGETPPAPADGHGVTVSPPSAGETSPAPADGHEVTVSPPSGEEMPLHEDQHEGDRRG